MTTLNRMREFLREEEDEDRFTSFVSSTIKGETLLELDWKQARKAKGISYRAKIIEEVGKFISLAAKEGKVGSWGCNDSDEYVTIFTIDIKPDVPSGKDCIRFHSASIVVKGTVIGLVSEWSGKPAVDGRHLIREIYCDKVRYFTSLSDVDISHVKLATVGQQFFERMKNDGVVELDLWMKLRYLVDRGFGPIEEIVLDGNTVDEMLNMRVKFVCQNFGRDYKTGKFIQI